MLSKKEYLYTMLKYLIANHYKSPVFIILVVLAPSGGRIQNDICFHCSRKTCAQIRIIYLS